MVSVRASAFSLTGDRPLLVLGSSLGTSAAVLWREVIPLVQDDFDVVGYDLPGHGVTPAPEQSFTMAELGAAVLRALAPEFGDRPFYFAGDSIGGAVGLELMLAHPERITAAALCCTSAKFGTSDAWIDRIVQVRASGTASLVEATAGRWFTASFRESHPEIVSEILAGLCDVDDAGYSACCQALAMYDVRNRLDEIGTPIVTVAGENDPSTPPAALREIAAGVQNSTSIELRNCAHLAPVDHPRDVADAVKGLLI